jgi:membrane-associated phospholipid phosphatase
MERPTAWLDHSLLHFVEGVDIQTLYSFPSGHTAIAFALAITLSLCLKNKGWFAFLLTLALLVGYSRIYLLQHHLMDVVAGAIVGAASSFIAYYLKPITWVHWFHKILQTYFTTKDGEFMLLPSFLVKSRRVKQWTERILSEPY